MSPRTNDLGQPIGSPVPGWTPARTPPRSALAGRWCRLEPLDSASHADGLHRSNLHDNEGRLWTYLGYGPFATLEEYAAWLDVHATGNDPLFFAIRDRETGVLGGVASYLRIDPQAGSIEVGHLCFAPPLQRTRAATEAMYLMMRQAFELGNRRYEWKCDALNAASRRAAERLGFTLEGVFRNSLIYKGRNRDTAWYSVTDAEWPARRAAFEAWLGPGNFDEDGRQRHPLQARP